VLIVEDNDALRMLLFTILRHQPLAVDTAATAEEAIEKVALCDYALIVVDMDMSREAGPAFVAAFRAEKPEGNTFVLAVRDPSDESFVDPRLVNAIMNKPVEIDTLAELVRECARVVPPPPEETTGCPPSESDIRMKMERGSYFEN
jgi:DNA-binding response OmpR family regulator